MQHIHDHWQKQGMITSIKLLLFAEQQQQQQVDVVGELLCKRPLFIKHLENALLIPGVAHLFLHWVLLPPHVQHVLHFLKMHSEQESFAQRVEPSDLKPYLKKMSDKHVPTVKKKRDEREAEVAQFLTNLHGNVVASDDMVFAWFAQVGAAAIWDTLALPKEEHEQDLILAGRLVLGNNES